MEYRKPVLSDGARLHTIVSYPFSTKPYLPIFLHGFPANNGHYAALYEYFNKQGVIAPRIDIRALGESQLTGGSFSVDAVEQDFLQVARDMKERYGLKVALMAHSFSTNPAYRAALSDKDGLIDAVVLVSFVPHLHKYARSHYTAYMIAASLPAPIRRRILKSRKLCDFLQKKDGLFSRKKETPDDVHLRNYHGDILDLVEAIKSAPDLLNGCGTPQQPVLIITALDDHVAAKYSIMLMNKLAGTDIKPENVKAPLTVRTGKKELVVLERLSPEVFKHSPETVGQPALDFLDRLACEEAEQFEKALRA